MKKILFILTLIFSAGALFAQSGQRQIREEARSYYHAQQEAMKAARNTGIEEPAYEEKVAAKAEAAKTAADEETAKKEFIEKLGKNIGHHARAKEYVRVFMEEGPAAYRASIKPSTFKLGKDFKTDVVKNKTVFDFYPKWKFYMDYGQQTWVVDNIIFASQISDTLYLSFSKVKDTYHIHTIYTKDTRFEADPASNGVKDYIVSYNENFDSEAFIKHMERQGVAPVWKEGK